MEELDHHPLENDLILETLTGFIAKRDLLRCRLVSRMWNSHIITRVRNEFEVRLDETALGRYSTFSQFLQLLLSSDQIPYGSYLFLNLRLGNPLLQKLLMVAGPLIRWLRIELAFFEILDLYGLRELLLHRAPNIQSLSLQGSLPEEVISFPSTCDRCPPETIPILPNLFQLIVEGRRLHPNFLFDFLRSCPNLRGLQSTGKYYNRSSIVLQAIKDSGHCARLTALHLNDIDAKDVSLLLRLGGEGMRLHEFSFKCLKFVESGELEQLIWQHKDSLRSLSLGEVAFPAAHSVHDLRLSFPTMRILRRLSRTAFCKPEIYLHTSNPNGFCFAEVTPRLEELELQAFADEVDWSHYFSDVNVLYPSGTLRKLGLPSNLKDVGDFEKLGRMFPNVQTVAADSPRNQVITCLWTTWPELKELSLILTEKNDGIDSVFTGIPDAVCKMIWMNSESCSDLECVRVAPNISRLKGLRKLHVETSRMICSENVFVCDNEPTCFLSNITGYYGLAFLPNIEDISLSCCEISEDCCQVLSTVFRKFAKIFISARNHVPVYEFDELQ